MEKYLLVLTTPEDNAREIRKKTRTALASHRLSDRVDFEVDLTDTTPNSNFFLTDPSGRVIYDSRPGTNDFPFSLAEQYINLMISYIKMDMDRSSKKP